MNSIAVGGHSSQNSIGVLGFAAGGDAPTITVVTRSLTDSVSMSDTITVRVTRARPTNRLSYHCQTLLQKQGTSPVH